MCLKAVAKGGNETVSLLYPSRATCSINQVYSHLFLPPALPSKSYSRLWTKEGLEEKRGGLVT